jgi:hypothetical protein
MHRGGAQVLRPNGVEFLNEGHVVFLAGTNHAIKSARAVLKNEGDDTDDESQPPSS